MLNHHEKIKVCPMIILATLRGMDNEIDTDRGLSNFHFTTKFTEKM